MNFSDRGIKKKKKKNEECCGQSYKGIFADSK